jgi:hypothetical protein
MNVTHLSNVIFFITSETNICINIKLSCIAGKKYKVQEPGDFGTFNTELEAPNSAQYNKSLPPGRHDIIFKNTQYVEYEVGLCKNHIINTKLLNLGLHCY